MPIRREKRECRGADPVLHRVREIALAFPGAAEKITHGHPAFYTKKVFAYFGGSRRVDGEWIQHERSIVVLLDEDERRAVSEDEHAYRPAYLGPSGWIGLDLHDDTDWAEIAELIELSFRRTAGKRLIARLDAGE